MDRWACGFRIAKLSALATLVVEREDSLALSLSRQPNDAAQILDWYRPRTHDRCRVIDLYTTLGARIRRPRDDGALERGVASAFTCARELSHADGRDRPSSHRLARVQACR